MHTGENGWFSPAALKRVNYDDHYVDRSRPDFGFDSWHDWFTRRIRPEMRLIDSDPKVVVHSADSYPVIFPGNEMVEFENPAFNAQA